MCVQHIANNEPANTGAEIDGGGRRIYTGLSYK